MTDIPHRPDSITARRGRSPLKIGDWVLYPEQAVLRSGDREVRLNDKALHVLLVLLDAGESAVPRGELLDQVWGATYPTDSVVSRAIADLRSAFGESAGDEAYIRTLPKFGYQLVATTGIPSGPNQRSGRMIPAIALVAVVGLSVAGVLLWDPTAREAGNPTGSAPVLPSSRPLTSNPGLEHQPRVAPAGDWVVYAALRPARGDWDILRVSVSDNLTQSLAASPGIHEHGPAVSPDGEAIAYVRIDSESCTVVTQAMVLGVPEPVANCTTKFPTLVDWSPDGKLLAYTSMETEDPANSRTLHAVKLADRSTVRLTHGVSPTGSDFYPRFSPSGDRLAFLRGEPQPDHRTTIWTVDTGTGEEIRHTALPAQYGGMTWLDEQRLIYSLNDAGHFQLRILHLETGIQTGVQSQGLIHPEFDPARNWLVGASPSSERALEMIHPSGAIIPVATSTSDEHHGVLSPNGEVVAFVSNRSGHDELWIADTRGEFTRRLTRFDGAAVRYPAWHPGGQRILFTVQTPAGEQLHEADVMSGSSRPVATSGLDATTPAWLPDGDRWVYGCRNAEGWGICLGDKSGARRIAGGHFRPTPLDNGTIAVVDSAGTLHRMDVSTGATRALWDGLPAQGRYGWTISGSSLLYLSAGQAQDSARLLMRDLDTGEETLLFSGALELADAPLSSHSETGMILFTRYGAASDDLVIHEGVSLSVLQ